MKKEFWFIVGSQGLYGEEVLKIVDGRAREMAQELSKELPYPLVYKVTAKSNQEITETIKEANYREECAGIVTWCHTFSPSKILMTAGLPSKAHITRCCKLTGSMLHSGRSSRKPEGGGCNSFHNIRGYFRMGKKRVI